ncbi:MAG: hypothetical protein WC796_01700 [Candidatus Pacearchaeota archaeon]|jgi:hypothetical protein
MKSNSLKKAQLLPEQVIQALFWVVLAVALFTAAYFIFKSITSMA